MIRSPFLLALLNPLNLSMLALTVAAGLCSAWWLAPVGFLFWLVMVIAIARDPGLQINFTRQSRQPLAQRYQNRFDRLDRARISIFNAMQGVSPAFQRVIEPLQSGLDDLVEHAYRLSLQMTALDNNFAVQRLSSNSDDDIAKMEKNIKKTENPSSRKEFDETLKSLQERKAQLKSVGVLLDRFEAQLTGTNNAVDSVVTNIISLKGRSAENVKEKVPGLLKIIEMEQGELKQFDAELEKTALI